MKIDAAADFSWLAERPLAQLLSVLGRDGEEARVVGGAVRNTLLGLPHGDVDVADESTQLAKYRILSESGTAMIAQANQSAQNVLKLLQS